MESFGCLLAVGFLAEGGCIGLGCSNSCLGSLFPSVVPGRRGSANFVGAGLSVDGRATRFSALASLFGSILATLSVFVDDLSSLVELRSLFFGI